MALIAGVRSHLHHTAPAHWESRIDIAASGPSNSPKKKSAPVERLDSLD